MATSIDLSGIRRAAERVAETHKQAGKVIQRARGTLRRRIVPEARRDIQQDYALKAGRITEGLRATNITQGVELTGSARGIGLLEFGAKQTATGLTAKVRKDGSPRVVPHGFIAPMLGGNKQATKRDGAKRRMSKGRYKGKMRQPLKTQYGPSIARMLAAPERADHLGDYAQEILAAEIARLLK